MIVINGTPNVDTLTGASEPDVFYGWEGNDTLTGAGGDDILYGCQDNDNLSGGDGSDLLLGNKGSDLIFGGIGSDILYGGKESDTLQGEAGNDYLFGDGGDDFLFSLLGADTLAGGGGNDTFAISKTSGGATLAEAAVVMDFTVGSDVIGLTDGIGFGNLKIYQGTGDYASDVIVELLPSAEYPNGRFLAILKNVTLESVNNSANFPITPNTAPTEIALAPTFVNENSANGTLVANLATTDPDAGDAHNYTLLDDAGGRFIISGNQLQVANGTLLDFESADSHGITVRSTDLGGLSVERTFIIAVNDVNDAPIVSAIAPQITNEDTPTAAIPFTIGDAETPAASLTVSATSSNPTLIPNQNIILGGSDGNRTITINPAANQFGSAQITVSVSDGVNVTNQIVDMTVNPVNDPPVATDDTVGQVLLSAPMQIAQATLTANDTDIDGNPLTVTAVFNAVNGIVSLNNGIITFRANPGYVGAATFDYTVDDGNGGTDTGRANLTVVSQVELNAIVTQTGLPTGAAGFALNGIANGDFSGTSVSSAGDVNGDGLDDLIVGAPGADIGGSDRGQSYVVFGKSDGTLVNLSTIASGVGGFALNGIADGDFSGISVSSAGDVNGDGLDDLIVGAHRADVGGSDRGQSYVVFGKNNGTVVNLSAVASGVGGFALNGIADDDRSGYSVSSAGDVNGDGLDDLIVGAHRADVGGIERGQSYVVFGKNNGSVVNLSAVASGVGGFAINGVNNNDYSGSVSSAGDINGDGLDDLIVGADAADAGGIDRGQSYVVFGKNNGTVVNLSAVASGVGGFALNGSADGDRSGTSVSNAGDVNGDGLDDLIVGALYADGGGSNRGQSYVVFGKNNGTIVNLSAVASGVGGFALNGIVDDDYSGISVSSAGDVNGDGLDDLIVGAHHADVGGSDRGQSYVVFGKNNGTVVNLSAVASGVGGFALNGIADNDLSGFRVSNAGDVNGDGLDDLIVGAPNANVGGSDRGQSYVVFGGDFTRSVTQQGGAGADALGGTAAPDVLVGAVGNDTLVGNGGADVLIGGAGDDILAISNTPFKRLDGGSGTDTLRLDSAGITLNLVALRDPYIQEIERIDLTGTGNNTLTLGMRDVLNLSDTTNTLIVLGDAGDVVNAAGFLAAGTSGGFNRYTFGRATLLVDADCTVNV